MSRRQRLRAAWHMRTWPWRLRTGWHLIDWRKLSDGQMRRAVERSRREGWKDIEP
jgi:hypothetical protein